MTNEQAIDVLNMVEAHGLADEAKKLAIKALQNDRPHGTWLYTPNISNLSEYEGITCSICGNDSIGDFDFCPNCGADMKGGTNE